MNIGYWLSGGNRLKRAATFYAHNESVMMGQFHGSVISRKCQYGVFALCNSNRRIVCLIIRLHDTHCFFLTEDLEMEVY